MGAKLETWTRVREDSQLGQTWLRSRSANEVSTSNLPSQASQRYSYIGIDKNSRVPGPTGPPNWSELSAREPRFAEYAGLLSGWPGLVSGQPEPLIVDCLVLLRHLDEAGTVLDVGSGGGMPGLALKLARPELRVTLLEADQRKAAFLTHAVAKLGLEQIEVVSERAELAAHGSLRESFEVVTCRALAPIPGMLELCLPFVAVGGRLLAMRTAEETAEVGRLQPVAARLGGGPPAIEAAASPARRQGTVVTVPKLSPTPDLYPRRPGLPRRRPLRA
jgi:16S rRNA (guanine527-N7)-methyltransferase